MKCECCGQEIIEPASKMFEEFWSVWPVKVKRKPAERTWKSRKLDSIGKQIIEHVRARISNDPRWQAGYVPNVTTFLNQDLWTDEIATIPKETIWPVKNEDWMRLGAKHGVNPGVGEDWPKYKDRVRDKVSRA